MQTISRKELTEKLQDEVALVEVLPPDRYREYHLPAAMNVPLTENFEENIQQAVPDKCQPVVVYCYDEVCSASTRAAKRLDELGYDEVYDYVAGKVDWKYAGLPVEA